MTLVFLLEILHEAAFTLDHGKCSTLNLFLGYDHLFEASVMFLISTWG